MQSPPFKTQLLQLFSRMKLLIPKSHLVQKFFFFSVAAAILPLIILAATIYWLQKNTPENENTFFLIVLIISLLAIACSVWFSWLLNKHLLHPIREVTAGLESAQSGEAAKLQPLNDHGLNDEVGELTRGYNQFLDVLKSTNRRDAALRQSEERYSLAIRGANDGIWDWDLRDNFCYYSPRWRYMLGYTEESVRNTPSEWFTRVHPDDLDELKADMNAHLDGKTPHFENEHRLRHADGTYIWALARGLALHDEEGKAFRFAGSISDFSARKANEARLMHDAMHDPLTGLPNRSYFMDILENALARTNRREDYHAAILFIDLDRFKLINDSLGHNAGDQLLAETTQRLKRCLRSMDTISRFSGDEFAIVLEEINGLHDAIQIARRIIQELTTPILLEGQEIVSSASIGIVTITRGYQDAFEILRDADTAMYQAKANGRARFEIFDKEMHAYTLSKLRMENELRQGIKNQEFKVFYQPILKTKNGEIQYVEALLRWQHPEKGLIATESFIPLAEESGLITNLNKWVLKAACGEARTWYDNGFDQMRISVNISPRLLLNPDLADMVRSILADSELPSEALQLEIIESSGVYNSGIAIQNLFELTSIGVQICLDDYGLVPSSLEQLKRLPIHTIKISQAFVKDIPSNTDDAAISDAIISMTHILGMQVIGAGIENQEQMQYLMEKECDYLQGFLFARPMNREDFMNLLLTEGTILNSRFTQ